MKCSVVSRVSINHNLTVMFGSLDGCTLTSVTSNVLKCYLGVVIWFMMGMGPNNWLKDLDECYIVKVAIVLLRMYAFPEMIEKILPHLIKFLFSN